MQAAVVEFFLFEIWKEQSKNSETYFNVFISKYQKNKIIILSKCFVGYENFCLFY